MVFRAMFLFCVVDVDVACPWGVASVWFAWSWVGWIPASMEWNGMGGGL